MEFPVTGLIILAAAFWFFFFSPRLLYAATIVSIPFSATAVANFGLAGSPYGTQKSIMAFQLFTVLWIAREALSRIPPWHRRGWRLTRRARFWLLVFLGTVALSLCVPLILNGTSWTPSFEAVRGNYLVATIPLRFSLYNLTQSAYLVFGVMIAIFVAAENGYPKKLLYTLKLYVGSCVFVAGWGLFQFWCTLTGRTYPAYIFNTAKSVSATGYLETITATSLIWGRISSVVKEPSALAEELVAGLALLFVCLSFRRPILPRGWNWLAIALMVAALTVSTSTTAYVGMLAGLILVGIALARAGKREWKYYPLLTLAGLAAGAFLAEQVPLVSSLVSDLLLHKYSGLNSGATRLYSVKIAAQAFLRHPILGAGWGSVSSWDLVFLILANLGLAGLLAFGAFLLPVFRSLWRMNSKGSFSATMFLPVLAWALISMEGGGMSYGAGLVWLVLGLAAGAAAAAKKELPAALATHRGGKIKRWLTTRGMSGVGEDPVRGLAPRGVARR